jgi:hypothetical protein
VDHGSEKCARIGPAILVPSKMEVWLDYLTRLVEVYKTLESRDEGFSLSSCFDPHRN